LCRCGASKNKPYCDNSHAEAGFQDAGALGSFQAEAPAPGGPVEISLAKDGPALTSGPLEIHGAGEGEPVRCGRSALCRCGASANKPFCDGAHKGAGFKG
jgi:CDGSH-type Zn-finger protein